MLLEPSVIVLYVNDVAVTSQFYRELLDKTPQEDSPTFHAFRLSNGMTVALKAKHTIEIPIEGKNGNGELAFIVESSQKVDELFLKWREKQIEMILTPTKLNYGYAFVAQDPDQNRLRVVALGQ